jgi:hypothetical protein
MDIFLQVTGWKKSCLESRTDFQSTLGEKMLEVSFLKLTPFMG